MDIRIHHAALSVPDLEASIRWYGEVFGFELEHRGFLPPVPADVAFLRRGSLRLELFQPRDGKALPADRRIPDEDLKTHGHKHVCFAVRSVEQAAAELRERSADIVFMKKMPEATILFLRDNAGNLIELFEAPELF
ncbi:MAG: VOC family protein [Steroidobacteraceae bacterium]